MKGSIKKKTVSMDWFKEKSTGNHRFSHEIWGCPVDFPLNQSIDSCSQFFQVFPIKSWKVQSFSTNKKGGRSGKFPSKPIQESGEFLNPRLPRPVLKSCTKLPSVPIWGEKKLTSMEQNGRKKVGCSKQWNRIMWVKQNFICTIPKYSSAVLDRWY